MVGVEYILAGHTLTPSTNKGVLARGAWKRRAVSYCGIVGNISNILFRQEEDTALVGDLNVCNPQTRICSESSNTFATLLPLPSFP